MAASHIYSKGAHPAMRYDLDNVKALCYKCHIEWWHKEPMEAKDWLEQVLPKARVDRLKFLSQLSTPSDYDYQLLKLYFTTKIKEYGGTPKV